MCFSYSASFETEVESGRKEKAKSISDAKEHGIWNMKFMKNAEDARRSKISAFTKAMRGADDMKELGSLEREVRNIENEASHRDVVVDPMDDPIGAKKARNRERGEKRQRLRDQGKGQSILGKRKFGYSVGYGDGEQVQSPLEFE